MKGDDGVDLEELIDSIDIVEYISQFVELEEKNGEYWGLSPFSDEKTPSFSVRRENNTFIVSPAVLEETSLHSQSSTINAMQTKQ